ncbi:MAG: adenylosuccinate synthase [bacterium]|nr:adenylosuccinate synthase [bacterium]
MDTSKQIRIIVGSQWGDEGKGKITDFFAEQADYVVRFQGGANAGHTLKVGEDVYKLHIIPSGILYPSVISIVGNGVLVDPKILLEEISQLKERGLTVNLKISERAHVVMPYHKAVDAALEGHQGKLSAGSTKRGIAPVAADKMYRHGIRVGDLLEPELLKEKLEKSFQFNKNLLNKVFDANYSTSIEEIFEEYKKYGELLKEYITDTELELFRAYKNGKKILFEGAQGMSLDPDHGAYPHTTSTNNVAGYATVGSGLGLNCSIQTIGVVKAYASRVGNSPFTTELTDELGNQIREKGQEYGTTTGRARRVGWLDLVQVRQSVRVSGLTDIAMTKLDILAGFKELKICVAYDVNGEKITEMPASLTKIRNAKPIYEILPGWDEMSIEQAKEFVKNGYADLPENVKKYIEFVEKEAGCQISIISLGPERDCTIVR